MMRRCRVSWMRPDNYNDLDFGDAYTAFDLWDDDLAFDFESQ